MYITILCFQAIKICRDEGIYLAKRIDFLDMSLNQLELLGSVFYLAHVIYSKNKSESFFNDFDVIFSI